MNTTYHGACHCGAVRFEIDAAIDHLRACDCSVCAKRGALMVRVPRADLRLLTPLDAMTLYQWGGRTAEDYFCAVCGILPFRRPSALTPQEIAAGAMPFDGWAVNARCLKGIDLASVPVRRIFGSRIVLS